MCFEKEPEKRPKASQLLHHSWFQDSEQPEVKTNQIDLKSLIKERNYASIIKNIPNILNKKIIYTNPAFVELLYDQESEDKTEFILVLVKEDYECVEYLSSIGLFNRIFSCISPAQSRINKLCAEIIFEILDASMKEGTIALFTLVCLGPLKKLFFL